MNEFHLEGHEFIELNKLLKILKWVGSGGEANARIDNGEIKVNQVVEYRKRNKLKPGDMVEFNTNKVTIK